MYSVLFTRTVPSKNKLSYKKNLNLAKKFYCQHDALRCMNTSNWFLTLRTVYRHIILLWFLQIFIGRDNWSMCNYISQTFFPLYSFVVHALSNVRELIFPDTWVTIRYLIVIPPLTSSTFVMTTTITNIILKSSSKLETISLTWGLDWTK